MMSYYVTTKEPAISLCPSQEPLYAGVPQWLCLQLCTDNVPVKSGDVMKIKTPQSTCIMKSSTDLYHINPTEYGGVLYLPDIPANSQMDVEIQLMAAMPDSKENVEQLINSQLDFDCPWSEEITCDLNFQLPFTTNHHLHTAGLRKFIQLKIESLSDLEFSLQEPVLSITTVTGDSVKATAMHKNTDMQLMHNTPISYVWTLDSTMENGHLDCKFEVNYKLLQEETNSTMQRCCHAFSLHSHQTEYVIESEVKAQSTSNCKAGTLCNLHFHITQVHDVSTNVKNTLLYEIVSSASLWAVCGKSSGVFTLPAVADASHDINLEVMPLIAGYIPVPSMKLSRYLSEDTPLTDNAIQEAEPQDCKMNNDDTNKPQLEEFGVGQIYNISRTVQVHVMPESNTSTVEVSVPQ
ncbi:trafficking protein particle complex subunit 10-like [Saccoglossus kowalevskii]|uniref:Trafficking protein particle complex subunit 10-like n=1 Tax=Saccoglossus kowalevskii TaxID=10224 RepID=A0ABM0GWJ6_SACKO|nr:PREDICTED: trafficking protein particle complex subunit 10-like [Saccoglossus kowalevskii]